MKKSLLAALFSLAGFVASAQRPVYHVKWGGTSSNYAGNQLSADARSGYIIGAGLQWQMNGVAGLHTGLYVVTKGARQEDGNEWHIYRPTYLQLPMQFGVSLPVGRKERTRLILKAGPYLAYGIDGHMVRERREQIGGIMYDVKEQAELFRSRRKKGYGMSRTDYGVSLGAVYDMSRFFIDAGVDIGLQKLYVAEVQQDMKNMSFHLSLGFKF